MSILRRTWGEALVGHMGIGFFMFLMAIPGILALVLAGVLFMAVPPLGVALGVLAVCYFILLSAVSSALDGIFLGALYQYAAYGEVPRGFDRSMMARAFSPKK
jgi:hypothetical protein